MTMISLPAHFDTGAAATLAPVLRAALADGSREAIVVDGGPVERVGLAGLQLLVGAQAAADAAGRGFTLSPVSEPLLAAATLIGAEPVLWQDAAPVLVEGSRDAA